ncbi:RNA polymerase sigma factor [Dermatophilaceae bacterium Soc4.6]
MPGLSSPSTPPGRQQTPGAASGSASRRPPQWASDAALARAAGLGDRQAFDVITERHGPALLRFARRMLRDADEAQDVVQEALVAGWLSVERWDGRSALSTWLFGITAHKARDVRRRHRPAPVDPEVLLRHESDVVEDRAGSTPEEALFRSALADALADLPERQRACWLLTQVEGLSQAEAAAALRMTPDAVRGQLARARQSLITTLEDWR